MSRRILFITSEIVPFHYGGIGTLFKAVAKTLRRRGYEVALLGQRPNGFDEEVFRWHYGDIPHFFFHAGISGRGGASLLAGAREVWRTFREIQPLFQPDVVVGADFGGECLLLFLDARSGQYPKTTFVLTINGITSDLNAVFEGGEQAFWERWLWDSGLRLAEAMERLTVSLANRIVAPTAWVWSQVRDRTGIEREVRIIPNLSDADLFDTLPDSVSLRDPVILFVGRLDRMKGADILLEAYLRLAERKPIFLPRLRFCRERLHVERIRGDFFRSLETAHSVGFAGSHCFYRPNPARGGPWLPAAGHAVRIPIALGSLWNCMPRSHAGRLSRPRLQGHGTCRCCRTHVS